MKTGMNQFAVLCTKVEEKPTANGGISPEAVAKLQAEAKDKAKVKEDDAKVELETPSEASFMFGGIALDVSGFAKLERSWNSAKGRLTQALKDKAGHLATLSRDAESRKKSAVKVGVNVALDPVITSGPKTVARVAKELAADKVISEGDAKVWVAYVTLLDAVSQAVELGKL